MINQFFEENWLIQNCYTELIPYNRLKHENILTKVKMLELWFLNFLMGNLRAYGGCLDSNKR